MYNMMTVFLTLQPHLLGIFSASPDTLCTKLSPYIEDEYTCSEPGCSHTYCDSRIEKSDIAIKWAAVL